MMPVEGDSNAATQFSSGSIARAALPPISSSPSTPLAKPCAWIVSIRARSASLVAKLGLQLIIPPAFVAIVFAGTVALCLAASLVNPYGWQLHKHTFAYLQAGWIKEVVSEFRSPSFRSENMTQYELLLLAGTAAAGLMLRRRQFVGPLWILFWAHQSLVSAPGS